MVLNLVAATLLMAEAPSRTVRDFWTLSHLPAADETVVLDLVRADVTILTSTDEHVHIDIASSGDVVPHMQVTPIVRGIRVLDVYRSTSLHAFEECVPQNSPHGAIWLSRFPLKVTVKAPSRVKVDARVLQGTVADRRSKASQRG